MNTPHLAPALELDAAMIKFSASLAVKGLPTEVRSQADVDTLINAFHDYIKELNFWQYYVLDVTAERASVKAAFEEGSVTPWQGVDVAHKTVVELAEIIKAAGHVQSLRAFERRFVTHVAGSIAAGFVRAAFVDLGDDAEALADAWVRVVDVINVPLYEEWDADTKAALEQMKNRVKYTRLDDHGPKLGPITEKFVFIMSFLNSI